MMLRNRQYGQLGKVKALRTLLIFCMVFIAPTPVLAQDDFFDEMLTVSDQDLEKASDTPEAPATTPSVEANKKDVQPIPQMMPPLQSLPVTPNIITPIPPQTSQQGGVQQSDPQVEILLEDPPVSDETLQKTGEVSEQQAHPEQAPAASPVVSNEDLIEKMLEGQQEVTKEAVPPAPQPQPIVPEIAKPQQGILSPEVTEVPQPVTPEVSAPQQEQPSTATVTATPDVEKPMTSSPQEEIILPEEKKTVSEEAAEVPATLPSSPEIAPQIQAETQGKKATPQAEIWVGSIMFAPDEYQLLRQAISIYERRTGTKTALSGAAVQGSTTPSSAGRTPTFYLGSIAYMSPEQWAVWLNNKKYTKDKTEDEVGVIAVSSDKVRLTWRVDSLDLIVPDWRNKLVISNTGNYVSGDGLVEVNNGGSEITFTLRPNQSFVSSKMKVVEGRTDDALSLLVQ